MAAFSKLMRTLNKNGKTKMSKSTLSCEKPPLKLDGLKIKAKLLLPMVVIPDSQPAMSLFRAGVCEKRKGKPVAILNFGQNCMFVTTKNQEEFIKNCTTITKFSYENIVSVDITERNREMAIVYKRPDDNTFLCVCLKLKTAREYGKDGKLSKSRKIIGKEVQQLLKPVLTTTPSSSSTSDEPSTSSTPHLSESISSEQIDESLTSNELSESEQVQCNEADSYPLETSTVSAEAERDDERSEEEAEWIIKIPSCPAIKDPSSEYKVPKKRCLSVEETLKNAMEITDPTLNKPAFYAQYWDLPKSYFHFQQTSQQSSAFTPTSSNHEAASLDKPAFYAQYWNLSEEQFYFQQPTQRSSAFTPCVSSANYNYHDKAEQSSTTLRDYYDAYVAYLWQLHYMLQLNSVRTGSSTAAQSTYSSQAGNFEPSVLYSHSEPALSTSHFPAFCLVNRHYKTSPHISYVDQTSIPTNPQSPLDIEAIESDC